MKGRRLPDDSDGRKMEPGDYFRVTWTGHENEWWFRDPIGNVGRIRHHAVTEHEDGTITVEPSIADSSPSGETNWHGFLRQGVWSDA